MLMQRRGNVTCHRSLSCDLTMHRMIEQSITSALILEDDADWDIRIKSQMQSFAEASRLLLQPASVSNTSHETFLDPSYPSHYSNKQPLDLHVGNHDTIAPTSSPYGDIERWDMLWLGHCGSQLPTPDNKPLRMGRALIHDDQTMPEPQHLFFRTNGSELLSYPPKTRVVAQATNALCLQGYALSLPGAKKVVYELGLHKVTAAVDVDYQAMCENSDPERLSFTCLAPHPEIFAQHRVKGNRARLTDNLPDGDMGNEEGSAYSRNIRWSTKMNFDRLISGKEDYVDLFKDGEEPPKFDSW